MTAREARRNAHNAYLAAQRGFAMGTATAADVEASQSAFFAACDAEHDAAARDDKRLSLLERGWIAEIAARRRIRMWGV